MTRFSRILAASAIGLSLTGCVTQEKYNALRLDRDRLAEANAKLQGDVQTAMSERDIFKNQLSALQANGQAGDALNANKDQQIMQLTAELAAMNAKYADALGRVGQGAALPAALDNELKNFAMQNPDLVEYDSARGIVKFKSDLTFATGDASLTPKAKDAITRFSSILNSPAASGYELLVAGHTDSSPVMNSATIQKGHKDNWYLSSHRAISVGSALISDHVSAQRIGCVGYADQRPVASNASEGGKSQNRRVEVLILPTTVRNSNPAPAVTSAPNKKTAPKAELSKDTPVSHLSK
jgi:chemotaxis protein MotB